MLDILRKNGLFANLKKCRFHKDEVRFFGYVVSSYDIQMEEERIRVVKNWPKSKSVWDIQVFIGFANFYRRFIRGFSRIAAPLTSMLKMIRSSDSPPKDDDNKIVGGGGDRKLSKSKKSKNAKSAIQMSIRATEEPTFLTSVTKDAFNKLRQVFTKTLILWNIDLKCHIQIETNVSGYTIGRVLSQLTSDNLTSDYLTSDQSQWNLVAYFLRKMIPAEPCYKTHNGKFLAIVEELKTWRYYLEGCKHEVLVLTDYNTFCRFMDTKSLSSRQVCWAQKLSFYHFRINYRQGKANGAADALLHFLQRSHNKEKKLWTENIQIHHCL